MILTEGIHRQILAVIRREPGKALILPEFCYWKGRDQPVVYVDNLPEQLARVLYRELIGPLGYEHSLTLLPHVPARNVNPFLFAVVEHGKRGTVCPNGHPYAGNEMPSNANRWRCKICYLAWRESQLTHGRSVADVNRGKDVCPQNHPYEGENLVILKNGRRRCRQCHRDHMAQYRAAHRKEPR